jgi:cellulose synthase/poly-beta-1,6-N-acetylglucosamine synthase-like glycosyltransferase
LDRFIYIIDWAFLFFFVGLNTSYFILLGLSLAEIFLRARRRISADLDGSLRSYHTHPVSIIAPAFNERLTIEGSVRALLALRYPEFEVVVVNDGSTDRTTQVMIEAFDMYEVHPIYQAIIPTRPVVAIYKSYKEPKLTLIDKVNGGKADALNCGINAARSEERRVGKECE